MKTKSSIVLVRPIILFVIVLIAQAGVTAQLTGSSCQCADVTDLTRLLGRYNIAAEQLEHMRRTVEATDFLHELMPDPNPSRMTKGDSLLKTFNEKMQLAGTDNTPNFDTPCMKDLDALRQSFHNSSFKDYQGRPVALRTYLALEKDTYVRAAAEILKRLNSMDRCVYRGEWAGTIIVRENKEFFSEERQPATDRQNQGGITNQTDTYTRTGRIPVRNYDTYSRWDVEGKLTRTEVHNSMHDCDTRAGEQFVNLVAYKTEKREISRRAGSKSLAMDISFDDSVPYKLQISFQIPEVGVLFDVSVSDTGVGGCEGEDYNRPEYATGMTSSFGPQDIAFEESIDVGGGLPPRINGSKTINLAPPGVSIPGVKLTHTARVTYNLYKLVPPGVPKSPGGKRRK